MCVYSDCHYAECRYAECCCAECCGAQGGAAIYKLIKSLSTQSPRWLLAMGRKSEAEEIIKKAAEVTLYLSPFLIKTLCLKARMQNKNFCSSYIILQKCLNV